MRSGTAGATLVVAVALVGSGVVAGGCGDGSARVERLPPQTGFPATDPRARDALVALVEEGARGTWRVDSAFVRTTGGRTLRAALAEVNRPPDHVVVGFGGVTGTIGGRDVTCSGSTAGPLCDAGSRGGAVDTGSYAVRAARSTTIAGIRARCFSLTWTGPRPAKPWGDRSVLCYSTDGVPLSRRVTRGDSTDDTRATKVGHTVTGADLDALLAPYRDAGPVRPVGPDGTIRP